jgi:outer membrane protein
MECSLKRHLLIGALAASFLAQTASADTLREALNSTYRSNPTLNAQRESLKSTDAGVAIARAAGRPTVTANVGATRDLTRSGRFDSGTGRGPYINSSVDLAVPVFQGGTVKNDINASKKRVEAGRATLRAVEGDVFTEAVAAYMDVIRDRATVELNANNVRVLQTNLEATRDRFQIGDVTRTDVAQSDARLSLAQARLVLAQGTATASEENYRRVIGKAPDNLAPPPPLPPLPATPDQAVQIALVNNADLIAISRQAEAARYDVKSVKGTRLPTISGIASADRFDATGDDSGLRAGTATSIGANARLPIYQGGLPSARIRQAQAIEGQVLEQQIGTERSVISVTRSAFADYKAALEAVSSSDVAVKANELALEGVRAENGVGTRSVLDVLNAEQELLNSQVILVTARRDAYVAGFRLLNAMGQAEADDLGLEGGPLYDPLGNYRRVAGDWNDWSTDKRHLPVSTRTVTPAEAPQGVTPTTR